jgi:hypothetical protein
VSAFLGPLAIVVAVAAVVFVAILIGFRSRRGRGTDLGEVSSQWVMEHRMGPGGHDSTRWNQR